MTWPGEPGRALPEGVEAQTTRVMANLVPALDGMGPGLLNVAQARVHLTRFERDDAATNALSRTYSAPGRRPARTCIGVTALAVGALVEIDMVAKLP